MSKNIKLFAGICLIILVVIVILFFRGDTISRYENYDLIENFHEAVTSRLCDNKYIQNGFRIPLSGRFNDNIRYAIVGLFSNPDLVLKQSSLDKFRFDSVESGAFRVKVNPDKGQGKKVMIHFWKSEDSSFFISIDSFINGRIRLVRVRKGKEKTIADIPNYFVRKKFGVVMLFFYKGHIMLSNDNLVLYDYMDESLGGEGNAEMIAEDFSPDWLEDAKFTKMTPSGIEILDKAHSRKKWADASLKSLIPQSGKESINLAHVYYKRTSRRSIILPPGSEIAYSVRVPEKGLLEFEYLGLSYKNKIPDGISLKLSLSSNGGGNFYELPSDIKSRNWEYRAVDLSKYSGSVLELKFSVHSSNSGRADDVLVFLGNPVIRVIRKQKEKNILVIMLDTLRADHLGCYGYKRDSSPSIDHFAGEGTLFESAITQSPWTLPAHLSFFTSLYPLESGHRLGPTIQLLNMVQIPAEVRTLTEYLKSAGYKTLAITGDAYVSANFGFDRGFEKFHETEEKFKFEVGMSYSADLCIDWIRSNRNYKWFMFYHTYEIHSPYNRKYFEPDESDGKRAGVIARYDSGIRFADGHVARILKALRDQGLYDNTMIILTSDHGESFYDHRTGLPELRDEGKHGHNLYDNLLKIPLIFGGATEFQKGMRIKSQVRLIDIFPTILEYAGLDVPNNIRGKSFLGLIDGKESPDLTAYAEGVKDIPQNEMKALRTLENKLIINNRFSEPESKYEYYNLQNDPGEKNNLASQKTQRLESFRGLINKIIKSIAENNAKYRKRTTEQVGDVDKLQKQLEALGYLNN